RSNESAAAPGCSTETKSGPQGHLQGPREHERAENQHSDKKLQLIKNYREKGESELRSVCTAALRLLVKCLIANAPNPESQAFYQKMEITSGTFVARGDDQKPTVDSSQRASQKTFDIKQERDILNIPEPACALASAASDEAFTELDALNEDSYKRGILITRWLSDNLH
ncbi:hypothetical protein HPG69_001245, partial [Diceros bicornis minor]